MGEHSRLLRALKGTHDVVPPASWRRRALIRAAEDLFARAGYAPIETPMFEHTEVFERGVGATSEVVGKEMYTFTDAGGRSLTLRPEGTAPVMRAILERGLHRGPLPLKLAYAEHMFRQERPQRGRQRQLFQLGVEAVGGEHPSLDAEVVELGARFLATAGVRFTLLLNSIGHPDPSCRQGYVKLLTEFLTARRDELAPEDRARVETNPLRTFDSKLEPTRALMVEAPLISDHLCAECREHFSSVTALLDELDVGYTLEPRLVRGLDYYSRTAFEYIGEGLGSQDAVGGGGRYDGLAETLGGPRLPGVGFALGLDRILLASRPPGEGDDGTPLDVYVVALGPDAARTALRVVTALRRRGVGADLDHAGRSLGGQMRDAARSDARWAVVLGEAELASGSATLRDLDSGQQSTLALRALEESWTP